MPDSLTAFELLFEIDQRCRALAAGLAPVQAQAAGVDYMVIGRPITQSADPAATLSAIRASLA